MLNIEAQDFSREQVLPEKNAYTGRLTYAAGKMKGSPLCYQLTMMADECERSPLALDAIQRL